MNSPQDRSASSPPGGDPRSRVCPRCGALNSASFDRCIRCGAGISGVAVPVDRLKRPALQQSLLATKAICVITIAVAAGQMLMSLMQGDQAVLLGGTNPMDLLRFGALQPRLDRVLEEPWRLLSSVFVHFGVIHLLMNLWALVSLARIAEPMLGAARFMIAYVVTGIFGFAVTVAWGTMFGQDVGLTAGASGAVFGVMGIIPGFLLRRRDARWKSFMKQAVLYSVLFGFVLNAFPGGFRVNNSAHLGGLAAGMALGFFFGAPQRSRSDLWVNLGAVASLVACIASLALTQLTGRWRKSQMPDPFSWNPPAAHQASERASRG